MLAEDCTTQPLTEKLRSGIQLARAGKYKEAAEKFQRILELHPNQPVALHNLALMQYQLGHTNQAIRTLQQVIEIDTQFPEAHNSLGLIHFQLGNYSQALDEFRTAISKNIYYDKAYDNYKATADKLGISLVDQDTDIVFYTGCLPFNGRTIYEKGLGGSESALFYLAKELTNLGYKVRVFNVCDRPGIYEGVEYRDLVDFYIYNRFNQMNIFISSRSLKPFKVGVQARLKILWAHDDPTAAFYKNEQRRLKDLDIDKIFAISRWQANRWREHFQLPENKIFITRNGVDVTLFSENNLKRNPNKLIYTSRPSRGLDILLKLFPRIRAQHPEVELHLFSYHDPEEDEELKPLIEELKQPGIFLRGSLSKKELAREMMTAYLLVYPLNCPEASCISAIEAQAAGLPIITTNVAALPETVQNGLTGIIVEGDPYSQTYQDNFVQQTLRLMRNREDWKKLSENGKRHARQNYDWKIIARQWESEFHVLLGGSIRRNRSIFRRKSHV
ncbi:MAG: glycosyltransferase [candidate division KSB1 bacterium]|nr:glycosyltransferase [candidate division KSB1 bacterium]